MANKRESSNLEPPVFLGLFVVATVGLSWTISFVTVTDTVPAYTIPLIMFVPAVVTIVLRRVQGNSLRATIGTSLRGSTGPSLVFAVVYPVLFIGTAAVIAIGAGLGRYQPGVESAIEQVLSLGGPLAIPVFLVINLGIMYGEELGWRGYLLPELTAYWGRIPATIAVGIVWGVYHSAFLYSAATVLNVPNPLLVTVVQAGAVLTASFPFAYSYYLTNGSVLPAMIFHLIWNILSPWILGDIYENVQGLVAGQVFVVSGEGIFGLFLGLIAVGGFVILFRRGTLIIS